MKSLITMICLALILPGLAWAGDKKKSAEKELDLENTLYLDLKDGRVTIELFDEFAPQTVERIKNLTRDGFYDGSKFHRVIPDFMAQTGAGDTGLPNLPDELPPENPKQHWRGYLSMANQSLPGTANSQFFILFEDAPHLDGSYTVFGKVVEGLNFVDKIKKGIAQDGREFDGEPDVIVRMRVAADVEGES